MRLQDLFLKTEGASLEGKRVSRSRENECLVSEWFNVLLVTFNVTPLNYNVFKCSIASCFFSPRKHCCRPLDLFIIATLLPSKDVVATTVASHYADSGPIYCTSSLTAHRDKVLVVTPRSHCSENGLLSAKTFECHRTTSYTYRPRQQSETVPVANTSLLPHEAYQIKPPNSELAKFGEERSLFQMLIRTMAGKGRRNTGYLGPCSAVLGRKTRETELSHRAAARGGGADISPS